MTSFVFLFLLYLGSLVLSFFLFSIHRLYGSLGTASRKLYLFFPFHHLLYFPFLSYLFHPLTSCICILFPLQYPPRFLFFSLSLFLFSSTFIWVYLSAGISPTIIFLFFYLPSSSLGNFCSLHLYNPIQSCSVVCFVSPFPPPRWAGWPSIGYSF